MAPIFTGNKFGFGGGGIVATPVVITYKLWGAGGGPYAPGSTYYDMGASGNYTYGNIEGLTTLDTLYIYVGQGGSRSPAPDQPTSGGAATFGGGGAGGTSASTNGGGSGGGASYIFVNQETTSPAQKLISVSGGGGGGSGGDYPGPNYAGAGGWPSGFNNPGTGGGQGGTQSAGGPAPGSPPTGSPGVAGSYLQGGAGGSSSGPYGSGFGGGGGGGGYYGGSGGDGDGSPYYVASGGGGGSSYYNPVYVPTPSFGYDNQPGNGTGAGTTDPDYNGTASKYSQPGLCILTVNGVKHTFTYTGAVQVFPLST